MDSTTRDRLHSLVLKARPLLVGEARDLLEGVYGLGKDGRFAPAASLPAVQMLSEVGVTRVRLETFLADEIAAGLTAGGAVEKLVKEVAFTHLNRLVAFKMLEGRKLVRGMIDRYHNSNAFAFYRAAHPDEEARYQAGSLPQDLLGEGPRDIAYRHFLLAQCAEMAAQIRVLFDPDNLPSRLFPRPHTLEALINLLNDSALKDGWQDDETIGWVYQYFNEVEKAEVFARFSKGAKVRVDEIAAATQLFTPRWIVRALVQNTLGRLWISMHPDSRLRDDLLDYLVPLLDKTPATPRLARDITLLDPACGTMHFGLVAFDLFAAMYREEIERAGEPGWLETPSVVDEADIPAAIVEYNLFGIDIDTGPSWSTSAISSSIFPNLMCVNMIGCSWAGSGRRSISCTSTTRTRRVSAVRSGSRTSSPSNSRPSTWTTTETVGGSSPRTSGSTCSCAASAWSRPTSIAGSSCSSSAG